MTHEVEQSMRLGAKDGEFSSSLCSRTKKTCRADRALVHRIERDLDRILNLDLASERHWPTASRGKCFKESRQPEVSRQRPLLSFLPH